MLNGDIVIKNLMEYVNLHLLWMNYTDYVYIDQYFLLKHSRSA